MIGYAILEKKQFLQILCLRNSFLIDEVIFSYEALQGKYISDHIKQKLNISYIQLEIDKEKNYRFYKLKLKDSSLIFAKFLNILRGFIGGILILYKAD